MALEDAAELAAYVQEYGICKEALRRYDVARRPRWRFAIQLTMAQGASTTTGVSVSRGFLDYTQDLYTRDFHPIGPRAPSRQGFQGFLASFSRFMLAAGVLTLLAVAGGGLLPEAHTVEQEKLQTEGELKSKGSFFARGARRARGALKGIRRRITRTRPVRVVHDQYDAAKHYAEKRAEGITDTTIDYGSQVAKRTLRRRLERFFGVF